MTQGPQRHFTKLRFTGPGHSAVHWDAHYTVTMTPLPGFVQISETGVRPVTPFQYSANTLQRHCGPALWPAIQHFTYGAPAQQ